MSQQLLPPLQTPDNPLFPVGRRIAALRAMYGYTQKQLSEMTGISQANISKIERGTYNPTVKLLEKIADSFKLRLDINFR